MFHETPIFNRLVAERGDVPAQVRDEANRVRDQLSRVLPSAPWPVANVPRQRAHAPGGNLPPGSL
ncbi:hypothetical protein ACFV2Z_23995 [Streptomyces sp. NPDC059688]|uniref:Uncharacterized protein n=2 Tax=Streptomyces TaxID=1883 RepID=A0ABV1U2V7_9ACTN|nr:MULTISPECIES: hypothetical protein [unclassified Streptomyces]OKJ78841.1 hypothetical protein AMK32_28465 [Streptomyces sp. CB01883]UXY39529.1 hypothetical protein N8I86_35405 [Streptomyces sp. HUAS 14-6]